MATDDALPDLARLDDPTPHVRLLANGRYRVVLTGAGTGFSAWNGARLTNWSGDRTEDGDGVFVYLRDLDDGRLWSAGHQPVRAAAERYAANYTGGSVRIERLDAGIAARMEVCVAPDADVELRRLTLENRSQRPRRIEVTTYAEVVLIDPAAYAAHPGFAKLFVQTEYVAAHEALLARRRPRSSGESHPWLVHALVGPGPLQYETDRALFVGRGRSLAAPRAVTGGAPLSGTTGNVLDPIMSMRRSVTLAPGGRAVLLLALGAAPSRDRALALLARVTGASAMPSRRHSAADVFAAAAAHDDACRQRLGISTARAEYFHELAGAMLYGHPALRAPAEVIARAHGNRGIPGELGLGGEGFAVIHVERAADVAAARELLSAQAYWGAQGVRIDVLALATDQVVENVRELVATARADGAEIAGGGRVVVRGGAELSAAQRDVIDACACLVVRGALPNLAAASRVRPTAPRVARSSAAPASGSGASPASTTPISASAATPSRSSASAIAANAYGAFDAGGAEYVVDVVNAGGAPSRTPPMPWVNVIANEAFGFLVSESGAANTWSRNSRENRLTPWYNDPVRDPHGEALYLRDEDTGEVWSPLPGPIADDGAFETRHGLGYTSWRHRRGTLEHEVVVFVPQQPPDPLKITRVRLRNASDRPRRVSLFAYQRLVLGDLPTTSGRLIVTEVDPDSGALLARNRLNGEFSDGVVFAAAVPPPDAVVHRTADRSAFLGRNGTPARPAALAGGAALDGTVGAALDACAALQATFAIPARGTVECAFLLGEAHDAAHARTLITRYRAVGGVDAALAGARALWTDVCSAVQVTTPVPAVDLLLNGWLAYQVLSCRLWGRTAFYQSGGAFGFRDQLQDAAAFAVTRPDVTRAQIVLHAAHQFVEGDVLHWWHPPTGRGIRTRFSDDLLWLPYVTAYYVRTTGDRSVLDERTGYVTARALAPGEDEAYLVPERAGVDDDVYAHCCRALDRSLTSGAHGLPLMGTGDWNDGMNRVGREGRGESVWMGFFLHRVLDDFAPMCERRGDGARLERYRAYQARLRTALDDAGWDGEWYRRAYYDDGTALGTATASECRIDALVQAWAVISDAAPRARAAQAMDAVERLLVDAEHGLVRLLTPPFDRDPHDPGYIKGYVPGIRENGGQYTHAALWVVQALAELGRRDRAAATLAMLSPVTHTSPAVVETYEVEPYVVAADIYSVPPHAGRGGWTWYTGSAGWMQRIALESVLGVRLVDGDTLVIAPRVPDAWPEYRVTLRLPEPRGVYEIVVRNPTGTAACVTAVAVDGSAGVVVDGTARIALARDAGRHLVEVTLGAASPNSA